MENSDAEVYEEVIVVRLDDDDAVPGDEREDGVGGADGIDAETMGDEDEDDAETMGDEN